MLNQQILSTEIYIHTSPISYNNLSQMLDERFEYSLRVVLFPKFKFSLLSLSLSQIKHAISICIERSSRYFVPLLIDLIDRLI